MGIEHPKYKVAVVQAAPAWLDLDASIDKTIALIEEAAARGARLIAFPEAFIPGYPWYIWLDSPAWAIGRGFVQRYFDNSLTYDSPQAERLRLAVRKAGITAVLGLSERDGGSLYLAQWLVGPDGETIATRRKLRPTHAERTETLRLVSMQSRARALSWRLARPFRRRWWMSFAIVPTRTRCCMSVAAMPRSMDPMAARLRRSSLPTRKACSTPTSISVRSGWRRMQPTPRATIRARTSRGCS